MANDGFTVRDDVRPSLVMNDGHAPETLRTLGDLMATEGPIFRQGDGKSCHGIIVRELSKDEVAALAVGGARQVKVSVPGGLLMPTPLSPAHVQDYAERHFDVVKFRKKPKGDEVERRPADFRAELARRFMDARLAPLRLLKGIAYTPILRGDGTIITAHGYDPETALWMVDDIPSLDVPEKPTRADALAAYETLAELIAEHRFETVHDRVAGVAIVMTPALRPSMATAPLLVADAPAARTGKDYLLGTAARIATGHPPVEFALSDNLEEQQKRMGAALLMGAPCLTLNNINGRLRSTDLTAYLTQGGCVTRAYATTGGALYAPNGNIIAASGNNIALGGDLPERALVCRQDADEAFPGERRFINNPHQMVLADRGKYLAAIFTIARWAVAGADYQPPDAPGFGGFEDFDRLIRRPLLALTGLDPIERGREQLLAEREQRWQGPLIDALGMLFGIGRPFRVRDISEAMNRRYTLPGEADLLASLRRDDLPYALRRARGLRGSNARLAKVERPPGEAGDVAWYALEALKPDADAHRTSDSVGVFPYTRVKTDGGVFTNLQGKTPTNPEARKIDEGVIL